MTGPFAAVGQIRLTKTPSLPIAQGRPTSEFCLRQQQGQLNGRDEELSNMSMFRSKKLDIGCYVNIRTIRDHTKRKTYAQFEPERCARSLHADDIASPLRQLGSWSSTSASLTRCYRQALRYIIRNTTLPARTRVEAQLQLTQMHCYTRPTQIRGRCIHGGKGRGVLRDFKMSRVSRSATELRPRSIDPRPVQLPNAGSARTYSGRQEGQLVERRSRVCEPPGRPDAR